MFRQQENAEIHLYIIQVLYTQCVYNYIQNDTNYIQNFRSHNVTGVD